MNPEVNKKKTPARKPDAELRRELTVIDDERQIKAILNPKRARIIDMLIAESATAKQVADAMGGTTGRIHYHIKELEKARLIEIVDRVEKGGVLEKYYRAVARNFYVGRGLGEHSQLGQDVRTMVSDSMLRWRRKQILRVDQNRIAERILDQCLLCEPGQIVALRGDPVNHEIITLFHHAIESRGLQCVVMYGRDSWSQLLARWKDDIAAVITIEEPLAGAGIDDVVLRRTSSSALYTRYLEELTELGRQFTYPELACEDPAVGELLSAGKRVLYFGYPSRQKAEILGLDFDALHDACWTALDVDYEQLTARCTAIQRLLGGADKVHLSSPGGTDLVFSIAGQEILADGGVRSDWETERGRAFGHLPAGMVMAPVVKGSADGIVVSEMADTWARGSSVSAWNSVAARSSPRRRTRTKRS